MSRYRRNEPDFSWIVELFFCGLGIAGLIFGWPVWVIVVCFAIGGIIFVATRDSDSSGGGLDLGDWF